MESRPGLFNALAISASDSSASTTPAQNGKKPGPGRLRVPSLSRNPSTTAKIAQASQKSALTRSRVIAGLLHQAGFPGDLLDDAMLLADLGDELLRRRIVLEDAEARQLGADRGVLHDLFDGGHECLRHFGRHAG